MSYRITGIKLFYKIDTSILIIVMEEKYMNDMRMAKYETLIEDIDSNIKKSVGLFGGLFGITRAVVAATGGSSSGNTALALIYD